MNVEMVRSDLLATKERLLTHGWVQRYLITDDHRTCLAGALWYARPHRTLGQVRNNEALAALEIQIKASNWPSFRVLPDGSVTPIPDDLGVLVMHWNDEEGRTLTDVIDLIDRTLASLPVSEETPVEGETCMV